MRTEREKELDELFRKGLETPTRDTNFREDDWDAMEALLDKNKKRRVLVFWLPILGSVAALLILTLAWLLIGNKHYAGAVNNIAHINKTARGDVGKSDTTSVTTNGQSTITKNNTAKSQNITTSNGNSEQKKGVAATTNKLMENKQLANKSYSHNNSRSHIIYTNDYQQLNYNSAIENSSILEADNKNVLALNTPALSLPAVNTELINSKLPLVEPEVKTPPNKNKPSIKQLGSFHRNLAITVLASPDINGVNSFQNSKVGTNIGLLFSVGISKKFTISTGALYSDKPYTTDFNNYHTTYQFSTNPENVSASCKVLDIPINVDYHFYNKYKNKLSIGSGLSSYFMLRENYHYNYEYANTPGPTDYNIANRNKYLLGVLNLDATYQRQINSKFSINIQPYLKVPLTNIGYSQVKLQSTGVAVGVTWNIGSYLKH